MAARDPACRRSSVHRRRHPGGIAARLVDDPCDARFLLQRSPHVAGHVQLPRVQVAGSRIKNRRRPIGRSRPRCHGSRAGRRGVHQAPARTAPCEDVTENALVGLAGGPALGALSIPNLSLYVRGLDGIPDGIQTRARVSQPADRPRIGDAGIDHAPRVDEAAREAMARHGRFPVKGSCPGECFRKPLAERDASNRTLQLGVYTRIRHIASITRCT